ncbi:unnamed protein product [Ascophyllum nodosum]
MRRAKHPPCSMRVLCPASMSWLIIVVISVASCCCTLARAFVPCPRVTTLVGVGGVHNPRRARSPLPSKMSLQTPPQQEKGKAGVSGADEKVNDSGIAVQPTAASVDGAPGDKKEGSSEKSKRLVVGVKDPVEQDVMWKLKFSTEDILAFADRAIDTAEDAFMHASRMFKPAAVMNLPLSPGDEPRAATATKKERIVVLGTGWGGHAISKVIDSEKFEVIYVSPRNYFIFTPMLAAASVGTVDVRSITEPIRMANPCVKYVAGEAIDINPAQKKVVVALPSVQEKRLPRIMNAGLPEAAEEAMAFPARALEQKQRDVGHGGVDPDSARPLMELSYDKLVYAIGTKTGTFGVPGVREYCYMLKEAQDARLLRSAIVNTLEEACLPGVTTEQKEKLLAFVVIGAGPTGVEFTGELTDLIGNDVPRLFPELLGLISVTVVSAGKVLPMFDKVLQDRGLKLLRKQGVEVLLGEVAAKVTEEEVILKNGKRIPYGLCFWAGGTEARPLSKRLIQKLGPEQTESQGSKRSQITVDRYMRALGSNGTIIALGDASSIEGIKMPTTGQVAAQEGAYVARLLNRGYNTSVEAAPQMTDYREGGAGLLDKTGDFFRLRGRLEAIPFHFINLGVLAYIGMGQAVAEVRAGNKSEVLDAAGSAGFFLWRSTYVVKQASLNHTCYPVSPRNRINVAVDWLKVRVFGRDITRL